PFSNTLYIEQNDFMEVPVKGFHRLVPGGEVRLKYAYIIKCEEVIKDADGTITELHCTYDPQTKSGNDTSGKKIKGTIHWVDGATAIPAQLRLYQNLFTKINPDDVEDGEDFTDYLNHESLLIPKHSLLEASLADAQVGIPYQFMRQGYFVKDQDSTPNQPVFNRIVSLKDSWIKKQQ
ncbi:MAG: glutamine--tRNA ligase, partial [Clostridiales bacterium]